MQENVERKRENKGQDSQDRCRDTSEGGGLIPLNKAMDNFNPIYSNNHKTNHKDPQEYTQPQERGFRNQVHSQVCTIHFFSNRDAQKTS